MIRPGLSHGYGMTGPDRPASPECGRGARPLSLLREHPSSGGLGHCPAGQHPGTAPPPRPSRVVTHEEIARLTAEASVLRGHGAAGPAIRPHTGPRKNMTCATGCGGAILRPEALFSQWTAIEHRDRTRVACLCVADRAALQTKTSTVQQP